MASRLLRLLLLAGGVAVLAIVIARIGPRVIADMLRRVGWGFLWVSVLYGVHVAVRAAALWRSLPSPVLRYSQVLRIRLAGEAVEMLTFTGPFLAEPAKAWLLTRSGVGTPEAFGAIAIEYLLYTIASAWMAAATLGVLLARDMIPAALHSGIVAIVVGVIAFTAGCVYAAVRGSGLIVPAIRGAGVLVGQRRADAAAARVDPAERVLVSFMHDRPARLAEVLAIEAASHALLASEIWIVLASLGVRVELSTPILFEGAIKFIGVVFFFIPGQLGASEGVYAIVANTLGYAAAAGLAVAFVRRVRALLVAAVGLVALARTGRTTGPPLAPERSWRSG